MDDSLKIKMYSFTLDCVNPQELAKFYGALMKWETVSIDEDWACVCAPGSVQGTYPGILFQRNPQYQPPVWPDKPEAQQQMAHIDFAVNDLEQSVQHAVLCGAAMADEQHSDGWRVMIDPAGHPFCLCLMKSVIEGENFSLL